MARLILSFCRDCLGSAPDMLTEALRDLPVRMRLADCLGRCDAPQALALEGRGLAAYLFDGIDAEADAADIAATCKAVLEADAGWIEDARPCGRLRHRLVTRVPA